MRWTYKIVLFSMLAGLSFSFCFGCGGGGGGGSTYRWTHRIGGPGTDMPSGVCTDTSGNVYVAGFFEGTVNFAEDWGESGTKTSTVFSRDIFVTKIGPKGNYLWTHRMGGESDDYATAICTDSDGNVYVAGAFEGTVNFADDWSGTETKTSEGLTDMFVTKINADGGYLWTHRMGGEGDDAPGAICTDSSGNIYVAGSFNDSSSFYFDADWTAFPTDYDMSVGSYDAFIMKINANGSYGWTHRIGLTGEDGGRGVCTDSSGNVYLAGYFSATLNFGIDWGDSEVKTCVGADDTFITKIDASGDYCWTHRIGGSGYDIASAICTDSSNNIYVTGFFEGSVNFAQDWNGDETKNSLGDDIFVTKLDADGEYVWTHRIGGSDQEYTDSICTDPTGNVYIAGHFQGGVNFAGDWSRIDAKTSIGYEDAFVTKITAAGNYAWSRRIGGSDIDWARAICADTSGNVYLTGYFQDVVNFAQDWGGSEIKTSAGDRDIFIMKVR
jgi:hypothetical protein